MVSLLLVTVIGSQLPFFVVNPVFLRSKTECIALFRIDAYTLLNELFEQQFVESMVSQNDF